ncbi:MAG: NAD-dependent epimerase [Nitrospirota bacterium]
MSRVLVTGAAGFIGFHLCERLLGRGDTVVGIDNLNDYYDVGLKAARLRRMAGHPRFRFLESDICDREEMEAVFSEESFDVAVNLAAQAGVRYSLANPHAYLESNVAGFLNVLEGCAKGGVGHLVFASSSSVYGINDRVPFSVSHRADHPASVYGATKKAGELLAHAYSHLHGLPCTGLRFFTVYGPWGRPDMAYFSFTRSITEGRPIDVYNHGRMQRDFTYIDDVVEGVLRIMERPPRPAKRGRRAASNRAAGPAPYRLYNIGNNDPVELITFIRVLEKCLGREARLNMLPMQPGDVLATMAEVDDLARDFGFRPRTPIEAGLERFVRWYGEYYGDGPERHDARSSGDVSADTLTNINH